MKKIGKTIRQFGYYLNKILYDYTVEVTNRFKGSDLIDRVPEELWTEVRDIVQEAVIKTIPRKRNAKAQWLCGEATQTAEKRRDAGGKAGRERSECRAAKSSKDIRKSSSVISAKRERKTTEWEG